jgi:hypothetical protein
MKHGRKTTTNPQPTEGISLTTGRIVGLPNLKPVTAAVVEPKTPKAKKAHRLDEASLIARYPQVQPGTLQMDTEGTHKGKQTVAAFLECGHVIRVATSDLFQVKQCAACKHPVKAPKEPKAPKAPKAKKAAATTASAEPVEHKRMDPEVRTAALHAA